MIIKENNKPSEKPKKCVIGKKQFNGNFNYERMLNAKKKKRATKK